MPAAQPDPHIQAVRHFNRFYTRQIGVLHEHMLKSPFSLAEVRVLYELTHRHTTTASELMKELGLDRGYLSRLLAGFERRGLIERETSERDARQSDIRLTRKGRTAFSPLDQGANREVGAMLEKLSGADRAALVDAFRRIESLLMGEPPASYSLRRHRPGDIGWVVQRHGEIYWQEYRWDERFEALVADIAAHFVQNYDSQRERCWIAECEGERLGCVFLVKASEDEARLRLLLVEPRARGLGLGKRLVEECITFARSAGYKKIGLWTNSVLDAARNIYRQHGFQMIQQENYRNFGKDLVTETWELEL